MRRHLTGALTVTTAAALMLSLAACGGPSGPGPSPAPIDKVGGSTTGPGQSPAPTNTAGQLVAPGSFDVAKLGDGWAAADVPKGAVAGLYAPCGEVVTPAAGAAKTFAFTAPSGYRVLVENSVYAEPATTKRAAIGKALLDCGAGEEGGAIVTNAILPAPGKLDSVGAHITAEREADGQLSHRSYWAAVSGNVLVSVVVTPPSAADEMPGGTLDTFAATVTQAALAAATGQQYGPVGAPAPAPADVPAGVDGPVDGTDGGPAAGTSAGEPAGGGVAGVPGPAQLPDLDEMDPYSDGPGASGEGYIVPDGQP